MSTPLLNNKLKRNVSNNNSVYSNRSSNRVLRSEMNSRSLINPKSRVNPPPTIQAREKLDTVPQNNS